MKWKIFIALIVGYMLSGCGTLQRSSVTSPSLEAISGSVTSATAGIGRAGVIVETVRKKGAAPNDPMVKQLAQILNKVQVDLANAQAEIKSKQTDIDKLTADMNKTIDRLNYLEPKYAAAVGIIWRWRMICIGMGLVMAGYAFLKFYMRVPFL